MVSNVHTPKEISQGSTWNCLFNPPGFRCAFKPFDRLLFLKRLLFIWFHFQLLRLKFSSLAYASIFGYARFSLCKIHICKPNCFVWFQCSRKEKERIDRPKTVVEQIESVRGVFFYEIQVEWHQNLQIICNRNENMDNKGTPIILET